MVEINESNNKNEIKSNNIIEKSLKTLLDNNTIINKNKIKNIKNISNTKNNVNFINKKKIMFLIIFLMIFMIRINQMNSIQITIFIIIKNKKT
jgi:hypothetical protein